MGYRRYYTSSYPGGWGRYHQSKRAQLAERYGGVDADVREAFFKLSSPQLESFFKRYSIKYGSGPTSYARKTYARWKDGNVQPSAQTSERLLDTLPYFLSFEAKCELLRKLREKHRRKQWREVTVTRWNWRDVLVPIVNRLIHAAYAVQLPLDVEKRLSWLASGDMQAGKALLVEAEAEAGKIATAYLEREFHNIWCLDGALPARKELVHTIELPYGTIRVNIDRRNRMNEEKKGSESLDLTKRDESQAITQTGNILQHAMQNLNEQQLKRVSEAAAQKGLDLEVEKVRAERKHRAAGQEMSDFVGEAERMQRLQGYDVHMQGDFESASGHTRIELKKRPAIVTIVIAVLIALVLLVLFNRG